MGTIREQRDDAALLAAAAAGDGDAFTAFYTRHAPAVASVLLRETRDRDQAADLVADVFAVALRRAPRYRAEHPTALPWLCGIARNKAHESRRQRRGQERVAQRLGGASTLVAEDDLDRVAELADHDGSVLALLDRLPDPQRAAVHARVVQERDYADIAREQGSSEAAVRQRVSRALTWLRAQLTVATVTAVGLLVAATAALAVLGNGGPEPGGGPKDTLPALLEVLRRPPQPGDAPPAVVAMARTWAARTNGPERLRGTIDPGAIRRLGDGAAGHRLYLAPVTMPAAGGPRTTAATGPETGLLILADADGRPVQRPYGLDAYQLREGAYFLSYGLRAIGTAPSAVMRSLQVQIVPDGITRLDYRYSTSQSMLAGGTARRSAAARGNAAFLELRGQLAHAPLLDVTAYDADGTVVARAQPQVAGGGPVAPRAVCRDARLPAGPTRRPVLRSSRTTVRELCAQAGLPLQAHREADGGLLLRYPDGLLVGTNANGRVGMLLHGSEKTPFPPRFLTGLTPASRLPR